MIKNGEYIRNWSDGKRRLICNFKNGKFDGLYRQWNEDGKLICSLIYENNKIIKILKELKDE